MTAYEPTLVEETYSLGAQRWRVDSQGNWTTLMWGWWPYSNGTPSYRWQPVPRQQVPNKLIRMAQK